MRWSPLLLLCFTLTEALAQAPNFSFPYLQTNSDGYIVEQDQYACPTFADWDEDGDQDMMIGLLVEGHIFYYENISTGIVPEFASRQIMQADGINISVPYG